MKRFCCVLFKILPAPQRRQTMHLFAITLIAAAFWLGLCIILSVFWPGLPKWLRTVAVGVAVTIPCGLAAITVIWHRLVYVPALDIFYADPDAWD